MEIEREYPKRKTFRFTFDPATARFALSHPLAVRITIGALVFVPLLVLAAHFEQWFGFWFALFWGGGITLWQVLAYGYGGAAIEKELKALVTESYSLAALIFVGVAWAVLIALVAVALYLDAQAPG